MRLRPAFPFALVLLAALVRAEPVVLKRTPKVGDKATFAIAATLKVMDLDASVKGTMTEEVVKVEGDVVTTRSTTKATLVLGGQEQDMSDDGDASTSREKLDGTPLPDEDEKEGERAASMRRDNATQVRYPDKPVSVGDTWTAEGQNDEGLNVPGYKITFKLEGEDKVGAVDAWKITAEGGETGGAAPTKIKATYWIDKATGHEIKATSVFENLAFSSDVPSVSGRFEVTIQP